mgnify:CR=1 FL=1
MNAYDVHEELYLTCEINYYCLRGLRLHGSANRHVVQLYEILLSNKNGQLFFIVVMIYMHNDYDLRNESNFIFC